MVATVDDLAVLKLHIFVDISAHHAEKLVVDSSEPAAGEFNFHILNGTVPVSESILVNCTGETAYTP